MSPSHAPQERSPIESPWLSLHRTLKRRPILVCTISFLLGILIADLRQPGYLAPGVLCMVAVTVAVLAVRRAPWLASSGVLLSFLFVGVFLHSVRLTVPADDISASVSPAKRNIQGTVVSSPERKWGRQVFRLRVQAVGPAHGDQARPASGLALVRTPLAPETGVGDVVRLADATVKLPRDSEAPGSFDYRRWLRRQGVTAEILSRTMTVSSPAESGRLRLAQLGLRLRRMLMEEIEDATPGPASKLHARLLMSMVYGLEAAPLAEAVVDEFRRAGTVHLLVVSGAQVTMLVAALLWLTGARLRTIRWWHVLVTGAALLVLVLIVGLGASVARAVAMFVLLMMALLAHRDYDLPTAIAFAALVICLFDTNALFSLSFQLTFAATIGVAAFIPGRVVSTAQSMPVPACLRVLRSVAWGTLGAWVLVTPLLAHYFRAFALLGNLANLVNVPLSGVTMVLGFLALPLVVVIQWLPRLAPLLKGMIFVLCGLSRLVLDVVIAVNRIATSLPLAYIDDFHLSTFGCLLWYAAAFLIVLSGLIVAAQRWLDVRLGRMHPGWLPIALLCLAAFIVVGHGAKVNAGRHLEVTFLPVGNGQCAIVRAPSGATMMVDCGGQSNLPGSGRDIAEGVIEPYLMQRGIKRLDFLLITHWDTDHYNALSELLDSVEVGRILVPPELPEAAPPKKLWGVLQERSAPARAGATVHLGKDVSAKLLEPRRPFITGIEDDANNNSVVVRLTYRQVSFLFTGDLETEGIERLVRDSFSAHRSLTSQMLQLPHHGRPMDGLERLLDAVAPTWAVASTGSEARYYLSRGVSEALARRGISLLRTDADGAVTFTTDGQSVRVRTSKVVRAFVGDTDSNPPALDPLTHTHQRVYSSVRGPDAIWVRLHISDSRGI